MKKCKIVCISKTIAIFLSIITCNIHLTSEKILSSRSGHVTFDDSQNIIGLRPPLAKYYVKSDNYTISSNSENNINSNNKVKHKNTDNSNSDGDHGDINIFNMMSQDEIKGLLDRIPMSTLKKLRSLTAIDPQLSHRFLWKMMKDKVELESEMKSHFLKPSFVDSLMTALWKEKRKKMMKTKEKVLRSIEKPRRFSTIHSTSTPPIVFQNFEVFQIPSEVFFNNIQGSNNNNNNNNNNKIRNQQNPKAKITTRPTTKIMTTTQKPKTVGGNTYIRFDHIVPAAPNSPQTFLTQTNSEIFPMSIKPFASGSGSGSPILNTNPYSYPSAHAKRILESNSPQQQQQQVNANTNTNTIPMTQQQWSITQQQLPVDEQNKNSHPSNSQVKWENWPPSSNQKEQQQAQPPNLIQQQQQQAQQQLTNTNSQIQIVPGILAFQDTQQQIPGSGYQFQQPQQQLILHPQTIPNMNMNNNYIAASPQNSYGGYNSIPNPDSSSSSYGSSQMMGNNFGNFPYQPQTYTQTPQDPNNPQWNQYYQYPQLPSQPNYMNNENTNYFSQPNPYQQQSQYFQPDPSQFYPQNQYQHSNFDYSNNNNPYYTNYEQNDEKEKDKDKDKDKDHHHGFFHKGLKGLKSAIFGHLHDKHEKHKEKEKGEKGSDDYNNNNNNNSPNYAESDSSSQSNYDHYSKKASHMWEKAKKLYDHMNKKAHDANHKGITTKIFGMSISILSFVSFGLYIVMLLFQSAVLTLNFPLLSGIIGFISGDGGAGLVQFFLGRSLDAGYRKIDVPDIDDLECKIKTAFNSIHEIFHMVEK